MSTIANRIMQVIDLNCKNKSEFAKKMNVTPSYVYKLRKHPDTIPSDRFIKDMCRKFGVNEEWIYTGEGEIYTASSKEEEIAEFFGTVSTEDNFTRRFISALSKLDADEWKMVESFARKLAAELETKNDQES